MPHYKYEIRQSKGALAAGMIEADTLAAAGGTLRAAGHYVLTLAPVPTAGAAGLVRKLARLSIQFGPGLRDVQVFTSQLSVMIKAGINIRSAIEGIADQIEHPKFRRIIFQIKQDVESGKPFSEALARHPKVFSSLYVNMVRASEMSGNFGEMLDRIAEYQAQQVETRNMVRGAMIYPAIIAFMAVFTTIFLLTFVLPRFIKIFEGKEDLLPAPTKALLAASAFLRGYWYLCVAGAVSAVWGFLYFIRTESGRQWWDATKLRIPIFKKMFRALYITRGLHTMGELVNAGVPMLDTLAITADVSGNTLYRNMWRAVYRAVKQGKKICQPLARVRLLPRSVVQMVSAGEESGKLGAVLRDVSDHYSKELKNTIKAVTAMIEPIMIVVMGFIVGFIAMSIILPIFKLSSLVK
jgi:type IV pilus assembly protein PilC